MSAEDKKWNRDNCTVYSIHAYTCTCYFVTHYAGVYVFSYLQLCTTPLPPSHLPSPPSLPHYPTPTPISPPPNLTTSLPHHPTPFPLSPPPRGCVWRVSSDGSLNTRVEMSVHSPMAHRWLAPSPPIDLTSTQAMSCSIVTWLHSNSKFLAVHVHVHVDVYTLYMYTYSI